MHHISVITLTPQQIEAAIAEYIHDQYPDAAIAEFRFLDSQGRDVTASLPTLMAVVHEQPMEGLGALGLLLNRASPKPDRPTPLVPLAPRPQLPGHGNH